MQGYELLIAVLMLSVILWLVSHIYDRRRPLNGVFFGISLGSISLLLMLIALQKELRFLQIFLGVTLVLVLIAAGIASFLFVIILFTSGIELIRKEGLSLAHVLSLAFGIAIVISSVVLPVFYSKITKVGIKRMLLFFSSYFTYFSGVFLVYASSAFVYNFYYERRNKDFLIVLGSGLMGEEVTPLLASRIDKAIDFYSSQKAKGRKVPTLIMSGGQGPDELISEAEAMKRYAIQQGIPEEHIIKEDQSTSTKENLMFSQKIIEQTGCEKANVLFFTNNFHVFRASLLAKSMGLDYHGLGAPTKLYFFISAFIREYIAYLFMKPRKHLILSSLYAIIMSLSLQ